MNTIRDITHDGALDIATGRHRKEENWRNRNITWCQLLQRICTTHRTAETYSEYIAAKKSRRDEIKDIGGFVGGFISGRRRKVSNVLHRQLITLDVDFATPDFWLNFTLLYGNAAAVYSTHKHKPDSPRLRLLLPLDRPVAPDEYAAISRRIAGSLGIELFDHTTFEVNRLMYWPSTSKDGEFLFEYQDGPWVSADEVLASYRDWKDSSEWPMSEKHHSDISRAAKKQGNPLEKPGIVGAFCRTYTIEEVIDNFLGDIYEPCTVEGRYSYKAGSTAGGLVVYEDLYAYSHHGTDPISGKLCNAFDLVRIHKFGDRDQDVSDGTPVNRLPSYKAMKDWAAEDKAVKKLYLSEKLSSAAEEFEGVEVEEDYSDDWKAELQVDDSLNVLGGIDNVVLILNNDPRLKGCLAFDEFIQREVVTKPLPWRNSENSNLHLKDSDVSNLRYFLKCNYGFNTALSNIEDALNVIYEANRFHSVRDYLSGLVWDGKERLDTLFVEYLGAEDMPYTRAVTRKALTAAVARVYEPGIKFDNMLTLVGPQGLGKSTIIDKLGGKWFSDSFSFHMLKNSGKDALEQLQGAWLIEVGELAGLNKTETEAVKSFVTKRVDRFRVAYGRRTDFFPRQCVFFGTTNNITFLKDQTGNRRFWPLVTEVQEPTCNVFTDLTKEEVDQIWAEAVEAYHLGEPLYLDGELDEVARSIQDQHTEKDDRVGLIQRFLDMPLPENWDSMSIYERRAWVAGEEDESEIQERGVRIRGQVCAAEIWCELLGGDKAAMTTHNTKFIHDIMGRMEGWGIGKAKRKFPVYGKQKAYYRIENSIKNEPKAGTTI